MPKPDSKKQFDRSCKGLGYGVLNSNDLFNRTKPMRHVNRDTFPHFAYWFFRTMRTRCDTALARCKAAWWGIKLGKNCSFHGPVSFKRFPSSLIHIGENCKFNSSPASNRIGINRPCMITALKAESQIHIGSGCGFSGTVIACGKEVVIGNNVRCGANTLIMDTDWHEDDLRTGPDIPVKIGSNVWLGVNVSILKGVEIGDGTIIGAGSLVTSSLPGGVMAAGSPARVIRRLELKKRE
jgi:acetyltransferase-like isoleucine patch superfamily enzyme